MGSAGLMVPSRLWSRPADGERKFLFIYCKGGWDTLKVFTPMLDATLIDTDVDAVQAEENGIVFTDHAERPAVRSFFAEWGAQGCVINGIEVRSITHERCRRIMLTGSGEGTSDWAVQMASETGQYYPLPHLVVTGPAFSGRNGASVVRAGENGQLAQLLGPDALAASDMEVRFVSSEAAAMEEAFLRSRVDRYLAQASPGGEMRFGELYGAAMDNLGVLRDQADQIELDPGGGGCRRNLAEDAKTALTCFEMGLSRCAMIQDLGWCSTGWDNHANLQHQDLSYNELFTYLSAIMSDLETRTATSGRPLSEEVTIVVMSEMGRHPLMNATGGRDHWTYTSAMMLGAGVVGGQVVGGLDGDFVGHPIDLKSGGVTSTGTGLLPGHLGATLLTLAGIDPGTELGPDVHPIEAVIDP